MAKDSPASLGSLASTLLRGLRYKRSKILPVIILILFSVLFVIVVPYSACRSDRLVLVIHNQSTVASKIMTRDSYGGDTRDWEDIVVLRPNESRQWTAETRFNVTYAKSIEVGLTQRGKIVSVIRLDASNLVRDGRTYFLQLEIRGQNLFYASTRTTGGGETRGLAWCSSATAFFQGEKAGSLGRMWPNVHRHPLEVLPQRISN